MTRFATVFAAVSMLVLPAATAFAGEGTYAPAAVASPASGPAIDRGTVRLGSYGFNAGLNG